MTDEISDTSSLSAFGYVDNEVFNATRKRVRQSVPTDVTPPFRRLFTSDPDRLPTRTARSLTSKPETRTSPSAALAGLQSPHVPQSGGLDQASLTTLPAHDSPESYARTQSPRPSTHPQSERDSTPTRFSRERWTVLQQGTSPVPTPAARSSFDSPWPHSALTNIEPRPQLEIETLDEDNIDLAEDDIDEDDEDASDYRDCTDFRSASMLWTSTDVHERLGPRNISASSNMIDALQSKIGLDWAAENVPFVASEETVTEASTTGQTLWRRRFFLDFYMALGHPDRPICANDTLNFATEKTSLSLKWWRERVPAKLCKYLPFDVSGRSFKFAHTASSNLQWYIFARPKDHNSHASYAAMPSGADPASDRKNKSTAMSKARAICIQDVIIETMTKTEGLEATMTHDGQLLESFHLNNQGLCDLTYDQMSVFMRAFFLNWNREMGATREVFWAESNLCFAAYAIGGNLHVDANAVYEVTNMFEDKFDCGNLEILCWDLAVNLGYDEGDVSGPQSIADPNIGGSFSLCGDKRGIMNQFSTPSVKREVYCYPMAWSPTAVSIQTKHCPNFVQSGLLDRLNHDLTNSNDLAMTGGVAIFSPATQMYSVLSHNVRKTPKNFQLWKGIQTGAYCINIGSAKLSQRHQRIRETLTHRASNARPFRQLLDSVRQAIDQKHYGYRIEVGMTIRIGLLKEEHRTFDYVGREVLDKQIAFWLDIDREVTFRDMLRRYRPEVSSATLC